MKKVLIMIAVVMAVLSSCSTKDIEQEATEQLKATMRETLKRPDDATLANLRTVFKSDSLCILQFTLKSKNSLGMDMVSPMEYIYLVGAFKANYEAWTDLDPLFPTGLVMDDKEMEVAKQIAKQGFDYEYLMEHTVDEIKDKYRDQLLKDAPYTDKDPNLEDRLMYSAACIRLRAQGREIPETKGKDIKL